MSARLLAIVLLCVPAFGALAQDGGDVAPGPDARETHQALNPPVDAFPTPMAEPLARICLALALVSAAGFGLTWWARNRRAGGVRGGARIDVVASRSLGARHQLAIVDVAGRRLLIGTGGDSIRTLADLSESEAFAAALERNLPEHAKGSELVDTIGSFEGLDA